MKSLVISAFLLATLNESFATQCEKIKAAIDMGSGATKMKVAKVDTCLQKIIEMLPLTEQEASVKIAYKEDLNRSLNKNLSEEIQNKGIEELKKMKAKALSLGATEFVGVATAVFRKYDGGAKNAPEFILRIYRETGINIVIIDQEQEALMGFVGAAAYTDKKLKDLVVWDIGGGSMQITTLNQEGKFEIYKGQIASSSFKDYIINSIQGKNIQEVKTPNPMSVSDKEMAEAFAVKVAEEKVPAVIKEKIEIADTQVIGIGGVHYHSIRKQVSSPEKFYTREQVESTITKKIGMTDQEIGGEFAASEVSNLILVSSFMTGTGITKVYPKNVTMSDGILLGAENMIESTDIVGKNYERCQKFSNGKFDFRPWAENKRDLCIVKTCTPAYYCSGKNYKIKNGICYFDKGDKTSMIWMRKICR